MTDDRIRGSDAESVAERYDRAFNERDLQTCSSLLDLDVELAVDSTTIRGREAAMAHLRDLMSSVPDGAIATERVVASTAEIVVRELRMLNAGDPTARMGEVLPAEICFLAGVFCEIMEVREARIISLRRYCPPHPAGRAGPAGGQRGAELQHLGDERAALRRVAELAAGAHEPDEALQALAVEASAMLGGLPMALVRFEDDGRDVVVVAFSSEPTQIGMRFPVDGGGIPPVILRTGRPARIDDYSQVRGGEGVMALGVRAVAGVPVTVDGRLWGMLNASSAEGPLPIGAEERLSRFAEIAAAAISSAQAREDLRQVAGDQAALLRVAELVAHGANEAELFDTVAVEAAGLIEGEPTTLVRYEGGRTFTILATHGGPAAVGLRFEVPEGDRGTLDELLRTRRPARLDNYQAVHGPLFSRRDFGVGSSVAVPIIVDDQLWGSLGTLNEGRRLPTRTEERLQQFAELVAAALANAQARAEIQLLADEQAALRRVAELVARGASVPEVFAAVSAEASRLLGGLPAALMRYDDDGFATVVASSNGPAPVGLRVRSDGFTGTGQVLRTGRSFRTTSFEGTNLADVAVRLNVRAGVSAPVAVEGRIWGVLSTSTSGVEPPSTAERRLGEFAGLAAAAIANAENRASLTASRARVIATADETRRRLQRDVHDGAQQRLVQTVLLLKLALDAAGAGESTAELIRELIQEALDYAERANTELRDLARGILPASLTRGGLRTGLESLIAGLSVPVHLLVDAPRLPSESETTAYFIVAEALTNVVKHAGATRAGVEIRADAGPDVVTIEVTDDGRGGADPARGTGLTGLQDRVEAAEGTLTVISPVGAGTVLRATIRVGRNPGLRAPSVIRPDRARPAVTPES